MFEILLPFPIRVSDDHSVWSVIQIKASSAVIAQNEADLLSGLEERRGIDVCKACSLKVLAF